MSSLEQKAFWAAYRERAEKECQANGEEINEQNIDDYTYISWKLDFLAGKMFFTEDGVLLEKDS